MPRPFEIGKHSILRNHAVPFPALLTGQTGNLTVLMTDFSDFSYFSDVDDQAIRPIDIYSCFGFYIDVDVGKRVIPFLFSISQGIIQIIGQGVIIWGLKQLVIGCFQALLNL